MNKLVLLRHGQSEWNRDNLFTGWHDADLTERGREEACRAGRELSEQGYVFDLAYTSVLKRAIRTLWLVLDAMDLMWIPVHRDWRLNERHYGALQGLNKAQTVARYGEDQVLVWRCSFDTRPPALEPDDRRHPRHDRRYAKLPPGLLPRAESLKDAAERFLPYWHEAIAPELRSGQRVLISAHGNALRALVKYLDDVSDADFVAMYIPTGMPLVYELDDELKPLDRYYIGDPEEVARAMQPVAKQGRARA